MKNLVKGVVIATCLTLGASGLFAAQVGNDWAEQFFKAKVGRNTPAEEARQQDALANAAFREEATFVATPSWIEQFFKAKVGRYTRGEESRLRELNGNIEFREETPEAFVAPTWGEQLFKEKMGRDVPGK